MGYVYCAPRVGNNKITLEGFDHLTWRYKVIPYIRTDNCTDMSNMFSGADYMLPASLDLRNFNTSNVTTMRSMFDNCVSQTILGLDNFDTSKVTDMAFMFNGSKATSLNLSGFDTSKVTDMENMFCDCEATSLNINGFDTSLVTNMSCMFENVGTSIDVSDFDTSEVTTMHNMFKGTAGTELDLSNFDTSNVTDMSGMFQESSYTDIDISSFNTSNVVSMKDMFRGSTETNLDLSNFDFSNVVDMSGMFSGTSYATRKTVNSLIFPNNADVSNVTNITQLFYNLTIPNLDLRSINFESAESERLLFSGLQTNVLDISTWDLGACASAILIPDRNYANYEGIFDRAEIQDLRFSNSNTFPEAYNISRMFYAFKTNGTLDLSTFHFNKCTYGGVTPGAMFGNARINTLILGDITSNEFNFGLGHSSGIGLFNGAIIHTVDMSNATLNIDDGNCLFEGAIIDHLKMPNKICTNVDSYYSNTYHGKAKYVDYSAVDTRNANYTNEQWAAMAAFTTQYNKIVWIPSTFILDGNRTMNLTGDVYTDALNYTDLGWNEEPSDVIMHYGATHSDFETAIQNDNIHEWISPQGYPIFFCHKSVPLNSAMTINQFEDAYSTIYYDGVLIDPNNFTFNSTGSHVIRIVYNDYIYEQTITVVNHGNTYTVVGTPYDYTWDTTNLSYTQTTSTSVQCRLYPDKYLFVYPIGQISYGASKYTSIDNTPNTTITKVSGIPFEIRRFNLSNCTLLTDISELIVCSKRSKFMVSQTEYSGFNPSNMFYRCTSLVDVSPVDKWDISLDYTIYERTYNGRSQRNSYSYSYSSMFSQTHITTAPKIAITSGSGSVFSGCTYLTDISKLKPFTTASYASSGDARTYYYIFNGCSSLRNVDHLRTCLQGFVYDPNQPSATSVSLDMFLSGTAITNTNFIPNGLKVSGINNMFYNCTSLTDISGMGRIYRRFSSFTSPFYNVPATDYSALSSWDDAMPGYYTTSLQGINFSKSKMSNLSFMSGWNLNNCTSYIFTSCPNLTSISALSNIISTTKELTVDLRYCSALTSLAGLEGCILGESTKFQDCSALTSLSGLQGCTIKNCSSLFSGCSSLSNISTLSTVTFSNITNVNGMFSGCSSLTSLNGLQGLDISNVNALTNVFQGCTSLVDISAIANWNPYQVKNVSNLFYNCKSITSFAALTNWVTDQLNEMGSTFYCCSSLVNTIGLNGFNPGQCTSLNGLFYGCTALEDISNIRYWYVANCTNMGYMFYGCTSLESIAPINIWDVSSLSNMQYMFYNDASITDADSIDVWKNKRTMTSVSRSYAFHSVPTPWPTWAVS